MSSTSHLTTTTSETNTDQNNLRILPCDGLSNLLHLSSSPTSNSKYLYYVNVEPIGKQTTEPVVSTQIRGKSTQPWYKRTRSPSDAEQKTPKMSRDRLLPLDRFFSNTSEPIPDADQISPTNDLSPLDDSTKINERNLRQTKENGYLRNHSSQLATRYESII